jgi:hypothetical protein
LRSEKISISIMAHPKRKHMIEHICHRLGYEPPISWESGGGRWETGKSAWMMHDKNATHHLVLQDDSLPCLDLPQTVERVVEIVPDKPISLFARSKKYYNNFIELARRKKASFMVLGRLNWGVAVLLPTKDIVPMIDYADRECRLPNYDMRIALYYLSLGILTYYTMPSLVGHRTNGGSLVWKTFEKQQHNRYARYFIGSAKSGLTIKWNDKTVVENKSVEGYYKRLKASSDAHK